MSDKAFRILAQSDVVAVNLAFVTAVGDLKAAVWLAYLLRESKYANEDGWFYKLVSETGRTLLLSEYEQRQARERCVSLGVIETKREGSPPRYYYRIQWDRLADIVGNPVQTPAPAKQTAEKPAKRSRRMTARDLDALIASGKPSGVGSYPADVQRVIRVFSEEFGLIAPDGRAKSKREKSRYKEWISGAHALLEVVDGDEDAAEYYIQLAAFNWKTEAKKRNGIPPYTVERPQALIKTIRSIMAAERVARKDKEKDSTLARVV